MENWVKRYFLYNYDHETKILFKDYFGVITLEDIDRSWQYAFKNNLILHDTKGMLLDYRKATFDIPVDKASGISSFYKENLKYFKGKRIAIVIEKPDQIVIPILVEKDDDQYRSRPFLTFEAAIEWILG